MPLTNAASWSQMCDAQAKMIENMTRFFPERQDELTKLSRDWRMIQLQLERGNVPRINADK
ncbi:hypothetical protein [Shewanella sp.]|uniref:hypothetical protein n=1 Tax=Shewanella sp. TaxID=50422 RepID=UPI003565FBD0